MKKLKLRVSPATDKKPRMLLIFLIFLLYLSGTVLMLKGGYDFFVYPKVFEESCAIEEALNGDDLRMIYNYSEDISNYAVYDHVKTYHNSSVRAIPPVIYPKKPIVLCFTPIDVMANGVLILLVGLILQFVAIWSLISAKIKAGFQITKKKRI